MEFEPINVVVCLNVTCRRQGAAQVLQAFQSFEDSTLTLEESGCLGHCGDGPMVLILPTETWYAGVSPSTVPDIIRQHRTADAPDDVSLPSTRPNVLLLILIVGIVVGLILSLV